MYVYSLKQFKRKKVITHFTKKVSNRILFLFPISFKSTLMKTKALLFAVLKYFLMFDSLQRLDNLTNFVDNSTLGFC